MSGPRRAPAAEAVSTTERLAAAAAMLARGDLAEAEATVHAVLAAEPTNAKALNLLGAAALAQGDGPAALRILSAAASLAPDRPEIVANLAVAHQMAGDGAAALAAAEHAAALAPHDPGHRRLVGQLLLETGDAAAARDAADALLAIAPDDPDALVFAASVTLAYGDRDAAEAMLAHAVAVAPGHAEAQLNLSELLALRGERTRALAAAERAQLAAPADLRARLGLARRLAEAGELDRAEVAVKRVLAVGPERLEPNELWSRVALARGEVEKAIGSLAELARRRGGDDDALFCLARLLGAAGRTEQALTIAEDLATRPVPPRGAEALRRDLLLRLGRFAAAWPPLPDVDPTEISGFIAAAGDPAETLVALAAAEALAGDRRLALHGDDTLAALLPADTRLDVAATATEGAVLAPLAAAPALAGGVARPARPPAVDPGRAAAWAEALAGLPRPLIGIAWSDGIAGPPLDALVDALDGAGTLVGLATCGDRAALAGYPDVLDGGRHLADLADAVAAVAGLDAVVAADGAVLAVAGALGRPAVAVLPPGHGWAWHAGEDGRATFFPSVLVRRQPRPGIAPSAWAPALDGLRAALGNLLGEP